MSGAAAGVAVGAAIARMQAIKASGVIVSLNPDDFLDIVMRQSDAMMVYAKGGIFRTKYHYLTSYRGLAFFAMSATPLSLPANCETIEAASIWIPQ